MNSLQETEITPPKGFLSINFKELLDYRDLIYFLIIRDLKVKYAQSVLGIGWAIIQPLFTMVLFTVIFDRVAKLESEGAYPIFSLAATIPWFFFANALNDSTSSLISNQNFLTKIYFPRLILPVTPVLSKLVDLGISLCLMVPLLFYYRITPGPGVLLIPVFVLIIMACATGVGMWLSALAVQYRDVRYGLTFGIQILMYASPVIYPASKIPEAWRDWYALNPMVGVIEGFRAVIVQVNPVPWRDLTIGAAAALVMLVCGALYFRQTERRFADVA